MATEAKRVVDRSVLQSVQRACDVMEEVARRGGPVTIAELATAVDLDRTIVYRIARTLESEGLLEAASGGFNVGPRALLYGNAYLDSLTVRRQALPYQVDLLDRVLGGRPWNTSILVPVGAEVAMVDTVHNPSAPLDLQLPLGRRFPMSATAAGRAILAFMAPDDVVLLVGKDKAQELGPELESVREHRLAFLHNFVPGVSGIAAPIFDHREIPVAALLLSGLELDDHLVHTSDVARALRRTADAISHMLH